MVRAGMSPSRTPENILGVTAPRKRRSFCVFRYSVDYLDNRSVREAIAAALSVAGGLNLHESLHGGESNSKIEVSEDVRELLARHGVNRSPVRDWPLDVGADSPPQVPYIPWTLKRPRYFHTVEECTSKNELQTIMTGGNDGLGCIPCLRNKRRLPRESRECFRKSPLLLTENQPPILEKSQNGYWHLYYLIVKVCVLQTPPVMYLVKCLADISADTDALVKRCVHCKSHAAHIFDRETKLPSKFLICRDCGLSSWAETLQYPAIGLPVPGAKGLQKAGLRQLDELLYGPFETEHATDSLVDMTHRTFYDRYLRECRECQARIDWKDMVMRW